MGYSEVSNWGSAGMSRYFLGCQHSFQLKYISTWGETAKLGRNGDVASGTCALEQVSKMRKYCHS